MEITVKLFATLREGRGKVVSLAYFDGITPQYILDELKINREDVAILLIKGRDGAFDKVLKQDDYLSIFPPVGGG